MRFFIYSCHAVFWMPGEIYFSLAIVNGICRKQISIAACACSTARPPSDPAVGIRDRRRMRSHLSRDRGHSRLVFGRTPE